MRYNPEIRPTAGELWASAPWYEKLGMLVFLGAHAYLLVYIFFG
jgi:hypothetical protein